MINNFPSNPLTNMAGLQAFGFAPYQLVQALPPLVNNKATTPVSFIGTNNFLKGYATIASLNFIETPEIGEHGPFYSWEVTGFTPGSDETLINLFAEMTQCLHLVTTLDYNNRKRLIGCNAPLNFTAAYGTGTVAGQDRKGYNFRFYGQSPDPAPAYIV